MSFLSSLENIGKDILKGFEIATPIIGTFVPALGPVLTEVAQIITVLEARGQQVSTDQISSIINTLAAAQAIKQSATTPIPAGATP
jgi:hypothetical protein